jgi:hypothetical protein
MCQDERSTAGTAVGADGGTVPVPACPLFRDGYCTNTVLSAATALEGNPGACNPNADPAMPGMDGCVSCARCISLGASSAAAGAPNIVMCAQRCTANDTDNDICRDGYQCAPDTGTCSIPECCSDLDCQTYVNDDSGDGVCDTSMGDTTHIDPMGGTCDTATGRCRRAGTATAHAGDHCTLDSQCEADGRCLDECQFDAFPGGYCTKNFCNIAGRSCATGDKCFDGGNDFWLCLKPCTVAAEDPTLVLGAGGHGDTCDPGYNCAYDNMGAVGAAGNGGCLPGNYNAITTNNVGHACTMETECYSPHGAGACIFQSPSSACAILGCAGYPDTENICGTGNSCFAMFGDGSSVCLHDCTTPADCAAAGAPADHACIQLTTADTQKHCWPACMTDADCQTGLTCMGATTTTAGNCM